MSSDSGDIPQRLRTERMLILGSDEAGQVADGATLVSKHSTLGEGDLTVLSWINMVVVLEQANNDTFVLRRFADHREAELFVKRRLDQYERMWDGCGCRIDYYEDH
ncbi:MAG: hypothetical protein R3178_10575 [Rhodothermales bacterium]|nr:hypothetical protein [Rhodothermales bacterium]